MLIVSGCYGATQRYRCFHHDEQLRVRGIPVRVVMQWHPDLLAAGLGCGLVVLHRVAMDPAVEALIVQIHDSGGVVLFDIDDLVFDPEATGWHRGVAHLPPEEQVRYHDGVRRYRETLLACDGAVVPTHFLAERVRALGKPVWLSPNCLDLELVCLSERAIAGRARPDPDRVVLGYASGSRTHDEDFAEAAGPALRRLMTRYPEVLLRTVGPLDLGPEWAPLSDRIESLPEVDWRELPGVLATFDISLAPLEIANPFCQAKSELKWLEASMCRVATVATATPAFAAAIEDGVTGLLAGSADDWEAALELLVTDTVQREAIATEGYETVRARRTTVAQAASYEGTLRAAQQSLVPWSVPPPPPAEPDGSLRVNFLLPEPVRGSGGHMSIMRMVAGLAEAGHRVTVHVDRGPLFQEATDEELARFFGRHFPRADASFRLGRDFAPADAAIATGWTTASAVAFASNARAKLYFVQDFEPYFQPMGPAYVAAESTYRLGLGHITLGPWLAELLCERYGAEAVPIDFGVEHDIYYSADAPRRPQVVFYGRGTTPRRGTELGLAALRLIKERRPDVDVILYGGEKRGRSVDGFDHVGVLTRDDLASLFRESVAGLALSYTNMSFVPLEMMACGCAVVAVDAPPVRWFLADGENAVVTESTAEALADGMLRVLDDEPLRRRLVDRGQQSVAEFSWDRSAAQFEAYVRRYAARESVGPAPESPPNEPVLDRLSGRGGDTEPLVAGQRIGWDLPCTVDGLYRIDLRLVSSSRAPPGHVLLRVKERASAVDDLAAVTREAAEIIDGAWLAFEFPSLGRSAGRQFHVSVAWLADGSSTDVALIVDKALEPKESRSMSVDGHRVDGCPAHRTFGLTKLPVAAVSGSQLERQLRERRRALAQLRAARAELSRRRVYMLVQRWRQLTRPMPPPALRPWPEETPMVAKLWKGLWTYGPPAVLHEVGRYLGWRRGERPVARVVDDADDRWDVGAATRGDVAARQVTDVRVPELLAAIGELKGDNAPSRRLRVGVVRSERLGDRAALADLLVSGLTSAGHSVAALPVELQARSDWQRAVTDAGDAPEQWDALVASDAEAASVVAARPAAARLLLATDDDAFYHPMGPEHVAAECAHRLGLDVLTLGPWLAAWLAERYGAAARVVGYPVDRRLFFSAPRAATRRVIYDVSRLGDPPEADLGVQTLIRLAVRLRRLEVVLFGASSDPLVEVDLPFRCDWVGSLDAPGRAALFRDSTALLVTDCTNLPLRVPEAMACGCAVVAADVGPVRWLLVDGRTAALAPPRGDVLAHALERVLTDEDYRERLVHGAQLAVGRMSCERTAAELVAVVEAAAVRDPGSSVPRAGPLMAAGGQLVSGADSADGEGTNPAFAFGTFRESRVEPVTGVDPDLDAMLGRLAALDQEIHREWVALEEDRGTLPYRLVHLKDWWAHALPPMDERPWPPDAPLLAKLAGTLRHYGPLALVREVGAWLRWRRMTEEGREEAIRGG